MARPPTQPDTPPNVALQGRNRLPSNRPVTLRVMRASLPLYTFLISIIGVALFVCGVWAGTSGHYREFIVWSTAPLSDEAKLRDLLLAPDLSERTLVVDQVASLETTLSDRLSEMRQDYDAALAEYRRQASELIALRADVPQARQFCEQASTQAFSAADYSFQTQQRYAELESYFLGALRACMATLDEAGADSQSPQDSTPLANNE